MRARWIPTDALDPAVAMHDTRVFPPPLDHRRFDWGGGTFETAHRPFTPCVEGVLAPRSAVLMVTLHGGAEYHESETDDGYRFGAPDGVGSVSFLPGGCTRRLRLHNVAWRWAALTLPVDAVAGLDGGVCPRPFGGARDDLVLGVLAEMARLHETDHGLDAGYCDAMALALAHHVARRYWQAEPGPSAAPQALPPWRLRRVVDHVEAHLGEALRIDALALLVGLSPGHFQRAFRASTGRTPLQHITLRRVEAAKRMLSAGSEPVGAIAPLVGFVSASHFARTFRAATGLAPADYRRVFAARPAPPPAG